MKKSIFSKGLCKVMGHKWTGCKCTRCSETRDEDHKFLLDDEKCLQRCSICDKVESIPHQWTGCKCTHCGKTRDKDHNFLLVDEKCLQRCSICDKVKSIPHQWDQGKCSRCGTPKKFTNKLQDFANKRLSFLHLEKSKNRIVAALGLFVIFALVFSGIMASLEKKDSNKNEMHKPSYSSNYENDEDNTQNTDILKDKSKKVYENAIGKSPIDVYNELISLGYSVSFKDAETNVNLTAKVVYSSEQTDAESYIPWIITDTDSYSETLKATSFLVANKNIPNKSEKEQNSTSPAGNLTVHYIDVGQGDSIFIHTNDAAMLIDAGDRQYGSDIVGYIKSQGINKLDYLILTHPHSDHIGGAEDIVNAFDIKHIIMPKASHTTKTFENLLTTIQSKGLKINSPSLDKQYQLGTASFSILGPTSSSYSDLNNYSIINRLTFGNTSFLFTGDAEVQSENEVLNKQFTLNSDVLKIGHHGSDTSTSDQFLKAVAPKYAVISCGKDNTYGHPTQTVLNRLASFNIDLYRTDELGTIIATSDGNTITFDKKASSIKQNAPPKDEVKPPVVVESKPEPTPQPAQENSETVYITRTGKKYHRDGCSSLSKSKSSISLSEAKQMGYGPCGRCNPPR